MRCRLLPLLVLLPLTPLAAQTYGSMRNGTFDEPRQYKADDPGLPEAVKAGWHLPADMVWPAHWGPNPATPNGTLAYVRDGGLQGTPAVQLDGNAHISSYFGPTKPGQPYVGFVRAKGHGRLWFGAYTYSATAFLRGVAFLDQDLDTDAWREVRFIFANDNPEVASINPALSGTHGVLVDEVALVPADPAEVALVQEQMTLVGTGALVEDLSVQGVANDAAFRQRLAAYRQARAEFDRRPPADAALRDALRDALGAKSAALEPYLVAPETITRSAYNEMVLMTAALQRVSGQQAAAAGPAPTAATSAAVSYKPGVRPPRPNALTVTDVHSNKVRYDEDERATTRATIANTTNQPWTGTAVAVMHLDLDASRELARADVTVPAGQAIPWDFAYSVGPETYGRGIEVRLLNAAGKVVDSWQEFYAVAAEWFRVQQHSHDVSNKAYDVTFWTDYYNQGHYFANEPTDFGVSTIPAEQYLSGQAGYLINQQGRQAQIDYYRAMGVRQTFYQTFAFCGPAGYEEMRRHPEYVLYDANGQPAVDPIYGGYPNPMELASPLEMGPKRAAQPPLDRRYTPWQHCAANLAAEEVVRYEAERIRRYAREHHFDGVYIDGNMGVLAGFGYDGKPNVPSYQDQEYARISARNHRIFSEILKRDDPNFGTWYNWSYPGLEWARSVGLTCSLGSGAPWEKTDENIRAATSWRNVMLLMETGSFLQTKEGVWSQPKEFLRLLCDQRDFAVQKHGANSIIGYSFIPWKPEEPGPAKWAWPTANLLGAMLIATQTHHAGGFYPSYRPWLQFQERYSSLLWAPDVKVVADEAKRVQVTSRETLWWHRLVYRRATPGGRERPQGYDLIVHLVRPLPTERWDITWPTEPAPLAGVKVVANVADGTVQQAWAARPYQFEEPQQPVQVALPLARSGTTCAVTVPPFRTHTMVVFRVRTRER